MEHFRIPPERELSRGRLQRRKEHLVNELVTERSARQRTRRRLALVLIPAVLLVLAATGFTTYVLTREATAFEGIGCFERASLEGNVAVVDGDGRHPRTVCREVWASGAMPGPVPSRLTACVLEGGAVGVFPASGRETCAHLGLANLPASYVRDARRFGGLRDALFERLGTPGSGSSLPSGPCVGEREAMAIVREELERRGFTDWSVEATDVFTGERPCAELAFDGRQRLVLLIPVPPR
jgi:hypothetical protein